MKNYNPKKVSMIIGAQAASGLADGTFITVEYDEDRFTKKTGADGEVTRVQNANESANIKLILMQTSNFNDYLSALSLADRLTGLGAVPVLIRDQLGTTLFAAQNCWVRKTPAGEFGKEVGTREWILDTDAADLFFGGASQ